MATATNHLDILDRTTVNFDVRGYYTNTGVASYARAKTPILGKSVHLKFETYDNPPQDILQAWSKNPIQIDRNAEPGSVNFRNGVSLSVTLLPDDEDRQALLKKANEVVSQTMKKVTSAMISIRFGSYNKFAENDLSIVLLTRAVDLCKQSFTAMESNESTVILHAGRESYHYDNLLDENLTGSKLSACFAPKYPNRNSRISELVFLGNYESLPEEKKD